MSVSSPLDTLHQQGHVTDIDRHFATLVAVLDGGARPHVPMAAALASARTREGHACLTLSEVAGRPWPNADGATLPTLESWREALETSPAVARPGIGERRPLVLDRQGRLYLERLWVAETAVAADIRRLAEHVESAPDGLEAVLDRLFPPPVSDAGSRIAAFDDASRAATPTVGTRPVVPAAAYHRPDARPRDAARATARHRLCVVSGGPGTGKTTIVAKLIALLTELGLAAPDRIALTAPTGKAAARLQEAVRTQCRRLVPLVPALEGFAAEAGTVHRWLLRDRAAHLPTDVLVVDEGSMVDLSLMARVLRALPDGARLVLLGDASQLASVQPGSVFADLCRAAGSAASPLSRCVVTLTHNWRFDTSGGVGRLAAAFAEGDAASAVAALTDPADDATALRPLPDAAAFERLVAELTDRHYAPFVRAMRERDGQPDGDRQLRQFRTLCAHRTGPFGSERFNHLVERRLRARGLASARDPFYPGRPVIVTRNDPRTGLSNGDIGVVMRDAAGRTRVWFPELLAMRGEPRLVSPARLPPHESFFALTVHRSQGSEYDEVAIVPGPAESRVATRELLYTAVTRSRRRVVVHGREAVVAAAVNRVTARSSGLCDALIGTGSGEAVGPGESKR